MYVALVDAPGRRRRLHDRAGGRVRRRAAAADVLRRIVDTTGHHVFEGYGLTETAPCSRRR
jgi:long-subunit acyl-CoA synthetase (AMP-forming)